MNFNRVRIGKIFQINGVNYIAKKSSGCKCGNGEELCVAKDCNGFGACLDLPLCSRKGVEMYFVQYHGE